MPFSLHSTTVAALPIVNQFLSRLRFTEVLSRYLPLPILVPNSTPPSPSPHS